jgi:hypothetical protein
VQARCSPDLTTGNKNINPNINDFLKTRTKSCLFIFLSLKTIFENSGLVVLELVVEVDIKYKKVRMSNMSGPLLT